VSARSPGRKTAISSASTVYMHACLLRTTEQSNLGGREAVPADIKECTISYNLDYALDMRSVGASPAYRLLHSGCVLYRFVVYRGDEFL
jgi:hypothetical protein